MLVWQKSMDLVDAVYRTVRRFPREELFVLSAQMRSAAVSIPCNIAEGCGR
ncbi:MAG TPA: four helix bundle protein [Thermoanaerobaculia bacterium]|nr:four helix bundle protein [Thermoanaerobaculia bacterium]